MTVITRIGRADAIGMLLNGVLFKYKSNYYLATNIYNRTHIRTCINIETGEAEDLPTSVVVETFDDAKIDILGRG